ncbi:MAG: gamma carbonic anhydrase family protein [Peptostreptococcus sp.]|uniref:gamma carbonic anhydrase family protein n=1 Tax=Peptostreptococcus sp. TaxID=1262 RepID=UPI002FCBA734
MIRNYKDKRPKIAKSSYVDIASSVIGYVELGEQVSVWPSASIRGDQERFVKVGKCSNIQDCVVIHGYSDTEIGEYVSIGHGAIVHGATIGNNVLIGMGAIVLDDVVIGDNCIVGAGALITGNKKFESGSMILGSPAKAVRKLSQEEIEGIKENALNYMSLMKDYD